MKIKATRFVGAHCIAGCDVCDFDAGVNPEKPPFVEDVKREARKHAAKTGHHVWVEEGITTHYDPVHKVES